MDNHSRSPHLIPPHDGYRELQSYQMAQIVYDATVVFCDRFISRRSRIHDQMVQAERGEAGSSLKGDRGMNGLWHSFRLYRARMVFTIGGRYNGNKHSCFQKQGNQEDDTQR